MWKWVLIAGVVLYILMEREKGLVKEKANRAAAGAAEAGGRGVVKIIDEAASAAGRWFGGLFNDGKPANTGGGSTGGSAASSPDYWDDFYDYGDV